MAINNLNEKFVHGLQDIYDAEHQFLKGQEEMLQNASNATLQQMIQTHIQQTQQQIGNLEQVFNLLGQQAGREACAGAKGIVTEGQKLMKETSAVPALCDCAIGGAIVKVEHYEIASYRDLITAADLMGQREIVSLLQQNLQQEESTAQLAEQSAPQLLQIAMQQESTTAGTYSQNYNQAGPTY